jgi:hypothetical protein
VCDEKNNILYCAAKAIQKSIVPAQWVQRTNQGRTPLICTLWVPIHLSFNSQQGPPFSYISRQNVQLYIVLCPHLETVNFVSLRGVVGSVIHSPDVWIFCPEPLINSSRFSEETHFLKKLILCKGIVLNLKHFVITKYGVLAFFNLVCFTDKFLLRKHIRQEK